MPNYFFMLEKTLYYPAVMHSIWMILTSLLFKNAELSAQHVLVVAELA